MSILLPAFGWAIVNHERLVLERSRGNPIETCRLVKPYFYKNVLNVLNVVFLSCFTVSGKLAHTVNKKKTMNGFQSFSNNVTVLLNVHYVTRTVRHVTILIWLFINIIQFAQYN